MWFLISCKEIVRISDFFYNFLCHVDSIMFWINSFGKICGQEYDVWFHRAFSGTKCKTHRHICFLLCDGTMTAFFFCWYTINIDIICDFMVYIGSVLGSMFLPYCNATTKNLCVVLHMMDIDMMYFHLIFVKSMEKWQELTIAFFYMRFLCHGNTIKNQIFAVF